jgi:hypothetical protein
MAIAEGSLTWKYNIKVKKNQETTEVFWLVLPSIKNLV